ncbi:MAG: PA2169 family four-helix-bundle protein [Steroidobacteraceae bacterium]
MHIEQTIRTLNRLVRVCRDGEDFCGAAARGAAGADLSALLRERSEEWGRLGDELQALVLLLGGEPATSGTLAARARHLALGARLALPGPADATIIAAWQGIERQAEARYLEAVGGYLPERIRRTVSLQVDRVAGRAERIRTFLGNVAMHSVTH